MARQQPPSHAIEIGLHGFGRSLHIRLNRGLAAGLLVLVPLALSCGVGSTLYVAFHDQVLTALLTRQSDMEYAYEDRISALRSQLDERAASSDPRAFDAAIREVEARGARLEAHAAMIDAQLLAAGAGPMGAAGRYAVPSPALDGDVHPAPSAPTTDLRMGEAAGLASSAAGLASSTAGLASLTARLTAIEARQAGAVRRLSEPVLAHIGQLRTALAQTGVPAQRWAGPRGVGGPFVPVPPSGAGVDVEQGIDVLREARAEAARLEAVALAVPLRKPVEGPLEVTSTFGARLDPFYGRPALHTGVDLLAAAGAAVRATAAGTVTMAGPDGGYGNMVEIDHGHGVATRYAHLSAIAVGVGRKVAAGDVVGRAGSSGRATGPHLHYETRIDGEPVDPARFLRAGAPLTTDASAVAASQP